MGIISIKRAAVMLVVVAIVVVTGSAQQPPACASKLIPCAQYLNSTKPPETCCGSLKEAVRDDLACLCSLFNNPSLLKAFNVDVNQALQLPKHCGITSDQSVCAKTGAPTTAAGPSSSTAPPATPGGNSNDAVSRKAWIGLSSLMTFLLVWWSIVA